MSQHDPLADLQWPSATVTPSESCSQAIKGTCTKGLCAERGVSAMGRALLTLGLSLLLLGYYTYYAMTDHRPTGVVRAALFGAVGWLAAQALLIFVTLVRPPGKRGSRWLRLGLVLAMPIAFICYLAFESTQTASFAHATHGYSGGHALGCAAVALVLGGIVGAGALFAWRRTDPYSPGLSGAAIGMVAGLATGSGMSVACASQEAFHVCFAHGLVVVALTGLGFGFGRRLLAP